MHACTDVSFGATLKDLPWYLHRHLMLRYRVLGKRGAILSAGTGPETGTIHVYISTHIDIDVNGLYLSTNNEGFVSLQGQTSHASELCTWI